MAITRIPPNLSLDDSWRAFIELAAKAAGLPADYVTKTGFRRAKMQVLNSLSGGSPESLANKTMDEVIWQFWGDATKSIEGLPAIPPGTTGDFIYRATKDYQREELYFIRDYYFDIPA